MNVYTIFSFYENGRYFKRQVRSTPPSQIKKIASNLKMEIFPLLNIQLKYVRSRELYKIQVNI